MASHPIDEAFNVDPSEEISEIFGMNLKIPDDPSLRTVVMFALQQYKELVESSQLLEAENKLETLALARDYLSLVKDTMHKESDLEIKSRNADMKARGKTNARVVAEQPGEEQSGEEQATVSRDDLLKKVDSARRKK